MLDTFHKRDNVRPTTPAQPGSRPGVPNLAHAAGTPVASVSNRSEPMPTKPALLEPSAVTAPTIPASETATVAPISTHVSSHDVAPSVARLTVGPDIKLKGAEITDCDTLIVEGQVDASMDSRVVEIAESGIFRGKVHVEVADIRGRFEGELTAQKQLVVRETGHVSGTIRYGKIRIDEGGIVSGDVAPTESDVSNGANPRVAEATRK